MSLEEILEPFKNGISAPLLVLLMVENGFETPELARKNIHKHFDKDIVGLSHYLNICLKKYIK